MLRPYQKEAVEIAFDYVKHSVIRIVIEMATGAGKSLVIAELARRLFDLTGQRTIVTAPKAELVKQNAAKFKALGLPCSIFSAKAGQKDLTHPVVFASPGTLINALDKITEPVAAIISDECDGITEQMKKIIAVLSERNPDLRLIGLTATPYRMGEGYIFRSFEDGRPAPNRNAFYDKRVYRIGTRELIQMGFLVDVVTNPVPIEYDLTTLKKDRRGKYTPASIERTFSGQGRRTSLIVKDIVERHQYYRACIIFCASRAHAREVMQSLPVGKYRYIDGDTPTKTRSDILSRFRHGFIDYLVNVDVLTVGTDLPLADHLALLRKTDSDRLLQQIIGRGLRLSEGKEHCLISDYAGNLQPFFEEGRDIFDPEIVARKEGEKTIVNVPCPKCAFVNEFTGRPNPERLNINSEGYFTDLAGDVVMYEAYQGADKPPLKVPFAAHYGRRCTGYRQRGPKGRLIRCSHTWVDKECPGCGKKNDIAAVRCPHCGEELADPNRYLTRFASEVVKAPDGWHIGKPKKCVIQEYHAASGKRIILLSITLVGRKTPLAVYLNPNPSSSEAAALWEYFVESGWGDRSMTMQEVLNRRKSFTPPVAVKFKPQANHLPQVRMLWRLPK